MTASHTDPTRPIRDLQGIVSGRRGDWQEAAMSQHARNARDRDDLAAS
jgi:hypothetical protein